MADASRIRVLKKVEASLPKKKIGSAYEKGMEKFYENIMEAMIEVFDFPHLKAIILGSPQAYQVILSEQCLGLKYLQCFCFRKNCLKKCWILQLKLSKENALPKSVQR